MSLEVLKLRCETCQSLYEATPHSVYIDHLGRAYHKQCLNCGTTTRFKLE